jgi:hypothetical protein
MSDRVNTGRVNPAGGPTIYLLDTKTSKVIAARQWRSYATHRPHNQLDILLRDAGAELEAVDDRYYVFAVNGFNNSFGVITKEHIEEMQALGPWTTEDEGE